MAASTYLALAVRFGDSEAVVNADRYGFGFSATYASFSIGLFVLWMFSLQLHDTRSAKVLGSGAEEYKRVAAATFRVFAVVAVGAYLLQADVARGFLLISLPLGVAWARRGTLAVAQVAGSLKRQYGRSTARVLLVGDALHGRQHPPLRAPARATASPALASPSRTADDIEGHAPVLGPADNAATAATAAPRRWRHRLVDCPNGPSLIKRIAWASRAPTST